MLNDLLALAVPAAVTALVTGLLKAIFDARRHRTSAPQRDVPEIVLPPGVRAPPPTRSRRRSPGTGWSVLSRLPPLAWRANPWTAALIGGPLVGFGIAGYFRTMADAVVGLALTLPAFVAIGLSPDEVTGASETDTMAGWAKAVVYANMALTGAYSYFRGVSSNRRLAPSSPGARSPARPLSRTEVLDRELQILASDRWSVHSSDDFEAILVRQKRPNHVLHLALTLLTLYLWAIVWVAKTRASRSNPQYEYRRLVVDARGHWSVEDVPSAMEVTSIPRP
jgi:hypothetical protein